MLITKLKSLIKRKLKEWNVPQPKQIYYFVPQCPVCHGWHTGRYVRQSRTDPDYLYRQSLAHGEIIKQVPREPIKNCFCEDCGYEWGAHIQTLWLSDEEMKEQQLKRGTYYKFEEYKEKYYVRGRPPKAPLFNRWFL